MIIAFSNGITITLDDDKIQECTTYEDGETILINYVVDNILYFYRVKVSRNSFTLCYVRDLDL